MRRFPPRALSQHPAGGKERETVTGAEAWTSNSEPRQPHSAAVRVTGPLRHTSRGACGRRWARAAQGRSSLSPPQECLYGRVCLLQPRPGDLLPAAGSGGAELRLPQPAGRCLQPPGQSQAEAAEARREPAVSRAALRSSLPRGPSQLHHQQRELCLLKQKRSLCVLFLGTSPFFRNRKDM